MNTRTLIIADESINIGTPITPHNNMQGMLIKRDKPDVKTDNFTNSLNLFKPRIYESKIELKDEKGKAKADIIRNKEYDSESKINTEILFEKIIVKINKNKLINNKRTINLPIVSLISDHSPSFSQAETYFVKPNGIPNVATAITKLLKFNNWEAIPIPETPNRIANSLVLKIPVTTFDTVAIEIFETAFIICLISFPFR